MSDVRDTTGSQHWPAVIARAAFSRPSPDRPGLGDELMATVAKGSYHMDDHGAGADNLGYMFWPARRFVLAEIWWLASELVRRNPALRVAALAPESDVDGTLDVRDPSGVSNNVFLTSSGDIHLFPGEDAFEVIEASAIFQVDARGEVIADIEKLMGWAGASNSSSPRTLCYRVLARVAAAKTYDACSWDVIAIDRWHADHVAQYFGSFVGLAEAYAANRATQSASIWAITQDSAPVAALTENATMYRPRREPIDLLSAVDGSGCSFEAVLARAQSIVDGIDL
jgi:hypothetical protein